MPVVTTVRLKGTLPAEIKRMLKAKNASIAVHRVPPVPRKVNKRVDKFYCHDDQLYETFPGEMLLAEISEGATLINFPKRNILIRIVGNMVYIYLGFNSDEGEYGRMPLAVFLSVFTSNEETQVGYQIHNLFAHGVTNGRYFMEQPVVVSSKSLGDLLRWNGSDPFRKKV